MLTVKQRGWLLPPAAVALLAGVFAGRATSQLLFSVAACLIALTAVLLLKSRLRFIACIVFAFTIGSLAGCLAFHPSLPDEGDYRVGGVISGEITDGNFSQVRVPLSSVTLNDRPVSGGAYWTFYVDERKGEKKPDDLLPGKYVSFQGSLYHPEGADNPDGYNFRESLLRRGIAFGVYGNDNLVISDPDFFSYAGFIASLRHRLSKALIHGLGEETGGYASALLLGMQSFIPSEDHEAFANLGIAHILSVSGFHVGVLIGILSLLFRWLNLRQKVRLVLYAVILLFYATLCGMNQPVIRAALFTLLFVEGRILNRPRSGLHLLSAVMILTILLSPAQVTGASFALTYSAVFGLLWVVPWAQRLNPFRNRFLSRIFESLLVTFGVQLALLLPELYFYQRLPLLSFLINLPAMAVFSVLIWLYWLALVLLPVPGLTALLSVPLSWLTGNLLSAVRTLGAVPGLTLWLPSANVITALGVILVLAGVCAIVRLSGKVRIPLLLAGVIVIVVSLLPRPYTGTDYIQFSIGNADAAVLRDRDQVVVIDTGTSDGQISGYLRSHRLTPDLVILTHLHSDHAGGLESLARDRIPVRTICLPVGAEMQEINDGITELLNQYREAGTEIRYLSRGDVIPLPSGTFTVLWPEKGRVRPGQDANHYSLVSRLVLKGTSMLLTGDLTSTYEMYAAAPADILKAAHHGSGASTSPEFLSAVSPDVILLSCKADTRTEQFMERTGGIPVWSTSDCGALTVRFDEGGYTIIPWLSPVVSGGIKHGS
jgi:competence protein ComEC